MADFCKACSKEVFGEDFGDMSGLITEKEVEEGKGALVLCEGCGPTLVNHEGRCIAPDCLRKGKQGHGTEEDGSIKPE